MKQQLEEERQRLASLEDPAHLHQLKQQIELQIIREQRALTLLTDETLFGIELKKAEIELTNAKTRLDSLQVEEEQTIDALNRMEGYRTMLEQRIAELESKLPTAPEAGADSEPLSFVASLLRSERQSQISALREALIIHAEAQHADITGRLRKTREAIKRQQEAITLQEQAIEALSKSNQLEITTQQASIDELQSELDKVVSSHRHELSLQRSVVSHAEQLLEEVPVTRAITPTSLANHEGSPGLFMIFFGSFLLAASFTLSMLIALTLLPRKSPS